MHWIDRILDAIWQVPSVIGVEWNQATDDWYRIDEYGNHVTLQAGYFDRHPVFGGMRRCTLSAAGTVNHYGANPRGDGLDLSGVDGRVMVEIPKFYVKGERPSANVYRWWISPSARPGYVVHPAFVQRGGVERDHIYVGAYNADFEYDGDDEAYNAADEKLHSRTGVQPYTGSSDCIWSIPIDDLGTEPAIGDEVSTPTEGGFFIVDYLKTAGAWGGGTAGDTAIIWLRKPGDATCGMAGAEVLSNDTAVNVIGNTTAGPTGRVVTITHARTLAGNIGAGWGLFNIWSLSAVQLLLYTEYAGADSQTLVGKGIVDKAGGTGFNGEISGFDAIDTNIGVNGTGAGTGVNGLTPIAYRGIENLWGNIWQFIDGYEVVDAEYRLINRDGSGTFANPIAGGDYEASLAVPLADAGNDGYISNIVYEDLLKYTFIAGAVAGSSGTYLCDYWYSHRTGAINILLAGGSWSDGVIAGVGCRHSADGAANTYRTIGARLEFVG
ncbi:MAG: hypothetical protein WC359_13710 [Dehalococcoidia bacterium]|jgi:hypothetical protein